MSDDALEEVKAQLKEEQRKSKRLEKEVERLSNRAQEQAMTSSSAGSAPLFEWDASVQTGDILNQGGFSVVHKGMWYGSKVAIKKLFDPNITQELLAEFDNEVQKLEQIRHPNILLLLAVHRKPPGLSIITELVEGGSLYQLLHRPATFNFAAGGGCGAASLQQSLDILEVAGQAIAFLHARGIVHRDVKSHNVLLSPHLEVKLCDFGLARMRSELMTGFMQFAGTPNYMAPEIFRNQRYSDNVDVFAFGTTLWEAAAGDIPWANMDPVDIKERVVAGQMLQIPATAPGELHQIIEECWIADRNERPAMTTVLAALRRCPREAFAGGRPRRPQTATGLSRPSPSLAGGPAGGTGGIGD